MVFFAFCMSKVLHFACHFFAFCVSSNNHLSLLAVHFFSIAPFVQKLPDGYHTMLGENGSTLSGGERQRISIARTLLKYAPITLLDEATASLDPENEVLIQEAISRLYFWKNLLLVMLFTKFCPYALAIRKAHIDPMQIPM